MSETIERAVVETPNAIQALLDSAEATVRLLRKVGKTGRRFLSHYGMKANVSALILATQRLRHCAALARKFRVVMRDDSIKRQVKASGGRQVSVPLVFAQKLPCQPIFTFEQRAANVAEGTSPNRHEYPWGQHQAETVRVSAQTPVAIPEVSRAIKEHRKKFDHVELWWVPNDILVAPLPDPDPILVGFVGIPEWKGKGFYFELHRWIDESVESPYWAKEGY